MLKSLDDLSIGGTEEQLIQENMVKNITGQENKILDGIHPIALPNSNGDSRKLLENVIVTTLSFEHQQPLYSELSVLVQQAKFDSQKQSNDNETQSFNEGIGNALTHILYDLENKNALYYLVSKYKRIAFNLAEIYEDFPEIPSIIKGLISGYSNFVEVLNEKLSKTECEIFRQGDLPVVR